MKTLINKINNLSETKISVITFLIVLTAIVSFFVFASAVDMNLKNWEVK